LPLDFGSLNSNGFVGGIYTGYNWQVGHAVVGIEGDFSYLGNNSSSSPLSLTDTFAVGGPGPTGGTLQLTTSEHWLASVRGRVGYAWDRTLLYATGGVAFTHVNYTQNLVVIPGGDLASTATPSSSARFGTNKVGYAAGVGAEWMFTQNWIFRLEYLHYGFDGSSGSLPILNPGLGCTAAVNCRFVATTSDLNLDSVRVGLAYKFGGPVVARY
jgi:outer membrane immunogenic protein